MTRNCTITLIVLLAATTPNRPVVVGQGARSGLDADTLSYKGFTVDIAAVRSMDDRSGFLSALRQQIDIVDGVTLSEANKAFFRSVPIVAEFAATGTGAQVGRYRSDQNRIVVKSYLRGGTNPILLHELLHAYHHRRLTNGARNADVTRLFRQAMDKQLFPADAYVLSNQSEYFAMMASVYLHGTAARDPLTRENIRTRQPDCYEWLEREFGRPPIK